MDVYVFDVASRVLVGPCKYAQTGFRVAREMAGTEYRVDVDGCAKEFQTPHINMFDDIEEIPEFLINDELGARIESIANKIKIMDSRRDIEIGYQDLISSGAEPKEDFPVLSDGQQRSALLQDFKRC